jgi:hypothetical protein
MDFPCDRLSAMLSAEKVLGADQLRWADAQLGHDG